jgi:hypothetical protein
MNGLPDGYIEEKDVYYGVPAIRRRKKVPEQKPPDYYLHIPMACITALASKEISAKAWPLALWVLWQYRVSGGKPATISTNFAQKAGVEGRSARRHAVNALEATGLFVVTRDGTEAAKIAPGEDLKTTMRLIKKTTGNAQ